MKDDDYIVPLNPADLPKKIIYRSSNRITDAQKNAARRLLRRQGYQGKLISIRYTRVDYRDSFKVQLRYQGRVGNFVVNTKNQTVQFKRMV